MKPVDALFRQESGRLVAALVRAFGVHNLAFAEDVAQDTLCRALEVWSISGMPENPSAWLMATAKNRAIDLLRRDRLRDDSRERVGYAIDLERTVAPRVDELFVPAALKDDLLRMMFSCCDPRIPEEAQVAVILNVLCGFSATEIAGTFLTGRETIKKRLTRAKAELATSRHLFDLTGTAGFGERLEVVQRALYLLFNEGYHGACSTAVVRVELREEAMRLARLLIEHESSATPASHALLALMCLHAARLPGRVDEEGDLTLLFDQDRSSWNAALIDEGNRLLNLAATGSELTPYHLEAGIAAYHSNARSTEDTPWQEIVSLYDALLALRWSPVIALSRALAIAQELGPERGLAEIREIAEVEKLADYPFYPAAIGELELRRGRPERAREQFSRARVLARNEAERRFFAKRLKACSAELSDSHP